jgi:hypothetical protein
MTLHKKGPGECPPRGPCIPLPSDPGPLDPRGLSARQHRHSPSPHRGKWFSSCNNIGPGPRGVKRQSMSLPGNSRGDAARLRLPPGLAPPTGNSGIPPPRGPRGRDAQGGPIPINSVEGSVRWWQRRWTSTSGGSSLWQRGFPGECLPFEWDVMVGGWSRSGESSGSAEPGGLGARQ